VILLVGSRNDPPLGAVASCLQRVGADYVCMDGNTRVVRSWSPHSEAVLEVNGRALPLDEVRSAYLRPVGLVTGRGEERRSMETLLAWADQSPAVIVNAPAASVLNNSKPLQSQKIRHYGLRVPETLVSTDPQAVREFEMECGTVIYKSTSGIRSIVRRLRKEQFPNLDAVGNCPTQFQRYIPGHDLRVHVIGNSLYALLIQSNCDDYRYASREGGHVTAREVKLDLATAASLRKMVQEMGLLVAGIDLRETPPGELYCLEVNPSPGFTYYEQLAGVELATHIAELLVV
jgi:glutathione synthase/RimK-type ligase-like ATP-grasp enzyme